MPGATLTYRQIFTFWLPLAGTWLMMAVEGPFLAAIIARLADPKFNLAAYGIAFAFAVLVPRALDLVGRGGAAPDEACWERDLGH